MRTFFENPELPVASGEPQPPIYVYACARVAVYDSLLAAPRVEEIPPGPVLVFIESLAARVYELARSAGGPIPYSVIREISENLIHACFAEPVVSIMDNGSTIRFSDCGPGVSDKTRAMRPGFTTATTEMKGFIRGVGSGLPIVNEYLSYSGGSMTIEDNLGCGTVVTLSTKSSISEPVTESPLPVHAASFPTHVQDASFVSAGGLVPVTPIPKPFIRETTTESSGDRPCAAQLTTRQKQVLALVMESGSAGPSLVSRELGIALSTSYRDLACLEDMGLIEADGGKRKLTQPGISYLDGLISGNGLAGTDE